MSKRRYQGDFGDMVEDVILGTVLAAGFVAIMAGMAIAELLRTPTEEKLRRLTPAETWGERVSSQSCRHCREQAKARTGYCGVCGRQL